MSVRPLLVAFLAAVLPGTAGVGGPPPPPPIPEWVNVSQSPGFSMSPRVRALPGGGAAIVWREGDVGGAEARIAGTADGLVYSAPALVSDTPGPIYLPSLAIEDSGRAHVAWREPLTPTGNVFYASADTWAGPFSASRMLSTLPPTFRADIVNGAPGHLFLLWDQERKALFSRSMDGGLNWSAPRNLTAGSHLTFEGFVDANAEGRVAVLQHVIKGPRGLAVLRLSGDAGASFGKRKVISDDFRDVGETALALGQGKRVYAAFVHLRGDLPNKPDRVVVWSGRNLKGAARIIGNGHEPALAVGVTGDVWLAWRNDGEIFLARSTDRGKSFSTPENISDTPGGLVPHAPGYSSHPSVDVDVNGRVYVAWQEAITDTDDEVAAFTLP